MTVKFEDFLQEQLQNEEFRKEYEALQPERAVIQAIIDARHNSGLTQKELSTRTGIAQGDISKLENGNANPSIRTLQRLANGMGMTLKVEFLPNAATTSA
jgi:transcriptional regulator with XRE-family HTH domain